MTRMWIEGVGDLHSIPIEGNSRSLHGTPLGTPGRGGAGGMTKGGVGFQLELVHGTPGQAGQVAGIPGLKRETLGHSSFLPLIVCF
jgi:hypothetical protein